MVNRQIEKSTRKECYGGCYKEHYEIATRGFTRATNSANSSSFCFFLSGADAQYAEVRRENEQGEKRPRVRPRRPPDV